MIARCLQFFRCVFVDKSLKLPHLLNGEVRVSYYFKEKENENK